MTLPALRDRTKQDRQARLGLGCLFTAFLLLGGGILAFFAYGAVQVVQARNWPETPCVILSSGVRTHPGDDGDTYSVEVSYAYERGGQKYTSDRYRFLAGSSSGSAAKQAVVDALPPGRTTVCYVNPRNYTEAVLNRGFTGEMWLGLIPLLFFGIGAVGLVFVFRKRKPAPLFPEPPAPRDAGAPQRGGPVRLKPAVAPVARFFIVLAIALFWNGIVSVFVVTAFTAEGGIGGCLGIFMIPFVLVGLGLFGYGVHQFLALFNPRPELTVNAAEVPLGGILELQWETKGNVQRIRSFSITLEGREEATYRRGTTTTTDKLVFRTLELAKGTNGKELRRGRAKVEIPRDTMHSFKAGNNKIVWALQVRGEIPVWPDVSEEFPLEILPLPVGKESAT